MRLDEVFELFAHRATAAFSARAVDDDGERVDRLGVDQDRQLDEVVLLVARHLVVERRVAARHRLQAVVEIEHHLVQRQLVDEHGAAAGIGEVLLPAAAVLAELQHRAEVFVGHQNGGLDPRLLQVIDARAVRHVGRVVHLDLGAVVQVDMIDDRRRGRDQVHVEFALEALGDDLQMEQAEEAAAETEAEGRRRLHLVGEAGVVEAQLAHRLAQIFEVGRIYGKEAAEHDRLHRLEPRQRRVAGDPLVGHGIADAGVGHLFDGGGEEADLARAELFEHFLLGTEDADAVDLVVGAGVEQLDLLALLQ